MSQTEPRPAVWVGHIQMPTDDLDASEKFMEQIGMRRIFRGDDVAILELRGGTHIVLVNQDTVTPGEADFDLMVEDLDKTHGDFVQLGLEPTEISRGDIHDSFTVTDPAGNTILFNSTHVSDKPV